MASIFGPNVRAFNDSMSDIQAQIAQLVGSSDGIDTDQFGNGRHAFLFMPGNYNLNVNLGYYTTVHGLGRTPDLVTINGGVQCLGVGPTRSALNNFWRGAENLAVSLPARGVNKWAVSQATFLRRFLLKGDATLWLWDVSTGDAGEASGGFIANSKIEGSILSASQQQFFTRNTTLTNWDGGLWNMVFVGDNQAPTGKWPSKPFTVVPQTPTIREKPYLVFENGNYEVRVPPLKSSSTGPDWDNAATTSISIDDFYIAKDSDTTDQLNNALQTRHLLLTPGTYTLSESLQVNNPGTIVFGLGMATLVAPGGKAALTVADKDGISISGIIVDASSNPNNPSDSSPVLVEVGTSTNTVNHSAAPITFHDISVRVAGARKGLAQSCFTINANDVILDNIWLWRADHGNNGTVGWYDNPCANGLTVNGDRVIAYGLFVEHFQQFQTLWNGNDGQVYFYQSEIPYDPPSQSAWQQNGEKGYPSYKVTDLVTSHFATGLGIYCYFNQVDGIQLDNAIETPTRPGIQMHHMVTRWLNGNPGTSINHIINGTGDPVPSPNLTAWSPN